MTENTKPIILITNDDGIFAGGINCLIEIAKPFGIVYVVAPDSGRSGMSHAITITSPLRFKKLNESENYFEYSCNGTPVDCVKIAFDKILPRKPDLILSGINHGSNASINIIYSGTMAAVIEGAMAEIPSIGFSLLDYSLSADFSHTKLYIKKIISKVLNSGLPKNICLNVNIPAKSNETIKGIQICRQAIARWKEDYEPRLDPHHIPYYWMHGTFINDDIAEDTDEFSLAQNYIAVVPINIDFTAHQFITKFKNEFKDV